MKQKDRDKLNELKQKLREIVDELNDFESFNVTEKDNHQDMSMAVVKSYEALNHLSKV